MENILKEFKRLQIVRKGEFVLKSGEKSNFYVDLKRLVSYPELIAEVSELLWTTAVKEKEDVPNFVAGVPYGAIPLATIVSTNHGIPQLMLRKEQKDYGTKKLIEGAFTQSFGQSVILVEDVVTTGSSVQEQITVLNDNGFRVTKVVAVVFRGEDPSQLAFDTSKTEFVPLFRHTDLFPKQKLSKVVLAYDRPYIVTQFNELIDAVGPHISGIKIHSEIMKMTADEEEDFHKKCKEHNLFIWEDRKFTDIASVVESQMAYYEGWRDKVTVTLLSGADVLSAGEEIDIGKIVVAEMSSKNPAFSKAYAESALQMMKDNVDKEFDIVCQSEELIEFARHHGRRSFVPGISLDDSVVGDDMGQQYRTPHHFAKDKLPDFFVIGRSLYKSQDPVSELYHYNDVLDLFSNTK